MLVSAGLPELVAHDDEGYVSKAVELFAKRGRLSEVKRKLARAKTESLLFDPFRFTRYLEAVFQAMVERREAGTPPDHILAP